MCTVTVVPRAEGVRVACNRDEQRSRGAAGRPRRYRVDSRWLTHPIDRDGGGTWIGLNDTGLVLALLNRAREGDAAGAGPKRSRGLVIPPLLVHETLDEAASAALDIDARAHRPFTLVGLSGLDAFVAESDGRSIVVDRRSIDQPILFTSSSLGDRVAEAARRPLFDELVLRAPDSWLDGQRRFHAHRWPCQSALSVVMSRADARTVSRTTVEAAGRDVRMTYEALADPCDPGAWKRGAAC